MSRPNTASRAVDWTGTQALSWGTTASVASSKNTPLISLEGDPEAKLTQRAPNAEGAEISAVADKALPDGTEP